MNHLVYLDVDDNIRIVENTFIKSEEDFYNSEDQSTGREFIGIAKSVEELVKLINEFK